MDWRPNIRAGGLSQSAPALASHEGVLHMVHRGDDSNHLYHARFNGTDWSEYRIDGPLTQSAPALASHGGVLHMVHRGDDSNRIFHARWDGASHWPEYRIEGTSGHSAPLTQSAFALASHGGVLHMVHRGDDSNNLFHARWDGASHWPEYRIEGTSGHSAPLSQGAPALASHGDLLHMVYQGDDSNHLWHSAFNGSSWTAHGLSSSNVTSALNIIIPGQASKAPPALASYDDMLRMVHLGDDSNMLWYSYLDPTYTSPKCQIWADPPTVIGESGSPGHAIHAVGHRRCTGTDPQAVRVRVRIRVDNSMWFDDTLAHASGFGVDVDVPVQYTCTGRGSENVFAEVILDDGQKAQSSRVFVPFCS
jgi:hypothetical protein